MSYHAPVLLREILAIAAGAHRVVDGTLGDGGHAAAFLAARRYQRFAPTGGENPARAGLGGWRRAVRATVSWARDRDG